MVDSFTAASMFYEYTVCPNLSKMRQCPQIKRTKFFESTVIILVMMRVLCKQHYNCLRKKIEKKNVLEKGFSTLSAVSNNHCLFFVTFCVRH